MNVVESQRYSFGFWCWSPEHGPAWRVSRSGAFPGSSAFGLGGRTGRVCQRPCSAAGRRRSQGRARARALRSAMSHRL